MIRCVRCDRLLWPWNSNNGAISVKCTDGDIIEGRYCNKCARRTLNELLSSGRFLKNIKHAKGPTKIGKIVGVVYMALTVLWISATVAKFLKYGEYLPVWVSILWALSSIMWCMFSMARRCD